MKVDILLFGITKDLVGSSKIVLDIPSGTTIAEFKTLLQTSYPELSGMESVAVALNSEYAMPGDLIQQHDEIALIPPVSGG